jgi:hypothetical protein
VIVMVDKSKDAIFVNIHVEHGGRAKVTHSAGSAGQEHVPRAAHHGAGASHVWKVAYKGRLYDVSTTGHEMAIRLDGETVWRGECGPHRTYHKHWSKLEPAVETKVLELARSGDRHSRDDRDAAPPPSGPRPSPRRRAAPTAAPEADPAAAENTAKKPAAKKPAAKKPAAKKAAAKKAAKKKTAPKTTAAKKETAPKKRAARKTAAKNGTVEVAAHSRSAPGSKPPSKPTPEKATPAKATPAKKTAAKRAAPKKPAASGEQPSTQRSVRPVDDEKVMTDLLKGLERDAPETAAAAYATLRKAWFNGARETVLAWVKDNPAKKSIAKAFAEWAGANPAEVRTMAAKAA